MTDSEKIQELEALIKAHKSEYEAQIKSLKAEREKMWRAINSLRHSPAIDVPRMDKLMQQRYAINPRLIGR